MYLTKLNTKHILMPKPATLQYYRIKFANDIYIYILLKIKNLFYKTMSDIINDICKYIDT